MATTYVKDAGTWKPVTGLYIKDAGTWKTVKQGWVKDAGVWKQFFSGFTLQNSPGSNYGFDDTINYDGFTIPSANLTYNSDGTWGAVGVYSGSSASGNWGTPTTAGIGSNYWVRYTRTSTSGTGSSTATTGWLQLNTGRQISATKSNPNVGVYTATWTIDLATDSSGTNIVKTFTNVSLTAEVI